VMTLTATSTPAVTKFLEKNFLGEGYAHLKENPVRADIKLTEKGTKEADLTLSQLLLELKASGRVMPRTLIFFKSLKDFGEANVKINRFLNQHHFPLGLYAVYHSLEEDSANQDTITRLKDAQGEIRLVCATSAFGMDVDVPGITRVWHVEPRPRWTIWCSSSAGPLAGTGRPPPTPCSSPAPRPAAVKSHGQFFWD